MAAASEDKQIDKHTDYNADQHADKYTDPDRDAMLIQQVCDDIAAEGRNRPLCEIGRRGRAEDDRDGKGSQRRYAHAQQRTANG